jgi:hypothetical protein
MLGFTQFEMSAGLNDSPKFIHALSQIVSQALGSTLDQFIPLHIYKEFREDSAVGSLVAATGSGNI